MTLTSICSRLSVSSYSARFALEKKTTTSKAIKRIYLHTLTSDSRSSLITLMCSRAE